MMDLKVCIVNVTNEGPGGDKAGEQQPVVLLQSPWWS